MRRLIRRTLGLSLILIFGSPVAGQSSLQPDFNSAIKQIDALAAAEYENEKLGSVTIGVVYGSKIIWNRSYGYADMERKIPATKDTVYRIGSITKMFTALMLLQLVEDGKVHFSDPVEKYFPEINGVEGRSPGASPITLIQLATHTSGLATEPDDLPKYLKGSVTDWEKVLIAALSQTKYAFEPGIHLHYSNIGYAILGAALSRASGKRYVDYIEQRIFTPLAMSHSALEPDAQIRANLSRGYMVKDGKLNTETPEQEHQGRGYKVPNGAIYTTVEDLARFISLELGEGPAIVLKKESIEASFTRGAMMESDLNSGYGLGFEVYRRGDLAIFGHGGGVAGYQAGALFDRSSRTGIIVLRNVSGGAFDIAELCMQSVTILARASQGSPK